VLEGAIHAVKCVPQRPTLRVSVSSKARDAETRLPIGLMFDYLLQPYQVILEEDNQEGRT